MSIYKQMKTVKDKVRYFLSRPELKHLRDDDSRLIATIYFNEIGKHKLELMSGMDLLTYFAEGKLPAPESIRRVRASLQRKHPELRGERYADRMNDGEEMRTNIHDL